MRSAIIAVPVRRMGGPEDSIEQDLLAVEEPLEIRVNGRNVAITMRTPGNDRELAAGFLCAEGILQRADQIAGISEPDLNVIDILAGESIDLSRLERHFYMSSSCGVCGKASIGALETSACPSVIRDRPGIDPAIIHRLPNALRERQSVFDRTGGLHACALFDSSGTMLDLR